MMRIRSGLLLAFSLVIFAACGGGAATSAAPSAAPTQSVSPAQPSDAPASQAAAPDRTPGTSLTACELVAPSDIEAALGLDAGTVAEGELKQKGTVLDAFVNECRYDDPEWGGLIVHVTPADGVNVFDAVESAFGDDAEVLDVADGGLWFEDNDRGYFLKGPVMILLQFTYLVDGTPFAEPTASLGQAAVDKI
jgi:hypothetical protein